MTIIYLVRHGESAANKQGILSGQINPMLTDRGRNQIKATRDSLADVRFDVGYSSDLARAVETAEIILGEPLPAENQLRVLRERTFGSLDGQDERQVEENRKEWQDLSDLDGWNYKFVDNMESDRELAERYIPALEEIARINDGKTVLIGSHGGVIRSTIRRLNNLSLKDLPPSSFKNGGFAILTYTDESGLKIKQIVNVNNE
jgi:broad specificity phosphatase PhoE